MTKELRTQYGLSQREFGKRIRKTGAYISLVESGKIKPSAEAIAAIEEVFGRRTGDGTLAERLRQARKKRGYTQGELAKAAECSRNTVTAAETGKSVPSAALIVRICACLWISEDWLRFGIGEMERSERAAEVLEAIQSDPEVRKAVEMFLWKNRTPGKEETACPGTTKNV